MRVEKTSGKKLFTEEQKFRQWWFWLLLTGIFLLVVIGNYNMLISQDRNHPQFERGVAIATIIIPILNLLFFYIYSLQTVITEEGIYYRWRPFRKKYTVIRWSNLHKVTVKDRLLRGLGAKYQLGYGWTHKVNGKKGVEIESGGNRVWLGTQRLEAFLYALEKAGIAYEGSVQTKQKTSL